MSTAPARSRAWRIVRPGPAAKVRAWGFRSGTTASAGSDARADPLLAATSSRYLAPPSATRPDPPSLVLARRRRRTGMHAQQHVSSLTDAADGRGALCVVGADRRLSTDGHGRAAMRPGSARGPGAPGETITIAVKTADCMVRVEVTDRSGPGRRNCGPLVVTRRSAGALAWWRPVRAGDGVAAGRFYLVELSHG
jgi:hypothetical protein